MIIKYGDLTEESYSDDDSSKKAKSIEKDGFKVLSKEGSADDTYIPVKEVTKERP